MKILHITAMCPLSPNSGIPVVLRQLTDAQNKLEGVNSIVLSLKGDVKDIGSPYFYFLGGRKVDDFLKEEKPDLAIIHSFFHMEYVEAADALLKEKIPFFVEPHGSFGKNAMRKSHIKKAVANATIFRKQIKGAIGYIFTNTAEMEDSIYRTKNDLLIPNGVLPEVINAANSKPLETIKNPVFYFLGRFDINHKGLDYLFDALDILDKKKESLIIRIFGTGTDEQIEYVSKRISLYKNLQIENMGTIYGPEKKVALENCNILLLTSRYEGSPMTILDGLSYGNPCVVTPGTNVADEVEKNNIGWKTDLDPQKIADCILKAEDEYRESATDMFFRCKKYVLDNYTWDAIAENSVRLYAQIINN